MIELYHGDHSVCAQKVRLALAEKKLEWDSHLLDLQAGDQHRADYLKLNPNAVVPTLVHDGRIIIESTVINEYIDDEFDGVPLRPSNAATRAQMRLWTKRLDEGLHYATAVISFAIAFRHIQLQKKSLDQIEEELQRVPDKARRERQIDTVRHGVGSSYFADAIRSFDKLFSEMEKSLADAPWLAGDAMSLADIAYVPYLTRFKHLGLLGMLDDRPHLSSWFNTVQSRESYDSAILKWENPKKLKLLDEKGKEAWPRIRSLLVP